MCCQRQELAKPSMGSTSVRNTGNRRQGAQSRREELHLQAQPGSTGRKNCKHLMKKEEEAVLMETVTWILRSLNCRKAWSLIEQPEKKKNKQT